MPTYDYRCATCGAETAVFQSISEYSRAPIRPQCSCFGIMERKLSVVPGSASSNPLAGDRHYEGLGATDGTNVGSRTKHREYMKSNNLALTSDFKNTWAQAAQERQTLRAGESSNERKRDVREVFQRAIQK